MADSEKKIKKIFNLFDANNLNNKDIQITEFEKNKVYLIKNGCRRVVFKQNFQNKNKINKEINFYNSIKRFKPKHFKIPEMLAHKRDEYIILEYIDGIRYWKNIECSVIANVINEFQNRLKNHLSYKNIAKQNIKPLISVVSLSLSVKKLKLSNKLKVFTILFKLFMKQHKFPNVLCHNDLYANAIFSKQNNLYIIDYEALTFSKYAKYLDIVHLAIARDSKHFFSLDYNLLNKYFSKQIMVEKLRRVEIRDLLRFAFIYKLLRLIHSKNWTTDVQKDANLFLVHTILNEKRFDTFMKKILKA